MTRNEAAERLRRLLDQDGYGRHRNLLEQALAEAAATERRLTVEPLRMVLAAVETAQRKAWDGEPVHRNLYDAEATLRSILDDLATADVGVVAPQHLRVRGDDDA